MGLRTSDRQGRPYKRSDPETPGFGADLSCHVHTYPCISDNDLSRTCMHYVHMYLANTASSHYLSTSAKPQMPSNDGMIYVLGQAPTVLIYFQPHLTGCWFLTPQTVGQWSHNTHTHKHEHPVQRASDLILQPLTFSLCCWPGSSCCDVISSAHHHCEWGVRKSHVHIICSKLTTLCTDLIVGPNGDHGPFEVCFYFVMRWSVSYVHSTNRNWPCHCSQASSSATYIWHFVIQSDECCL